MIYIYIVIIKTITSRKTWGTIQYKKYKLNFKLSKLILGIK